MPKKTNLTNSNKPIVIEQQHIIIENKRYEVDGKNVVYDPSENEKEIAIWLTRKLNKNVTLLPRVIWPQRIKTPDYIIDNERWDLKTIHSSRKNILFNRLKNKQEQSSNFVIDITESDLGENDIVEQLKYLYNNKKFNWLDKIIIKNGDNYTKINRK